MARPKPRPDVSPRIWTEEDVAHRMGMSIATFRKRLLEMHAAGMPERDPLFGGYDSAAVEMWMDRRAGLAPTATAPTGKPRRTLDDVRW